MKLFHALSILLTVLSVEGKMNGPSSSVSYGGATPSKKGPKAGGAVSGSAAVQAAAQEVTAILGEGTVQNNQGPTTWWGIPLDRMPGLQADIDKLNGLLEEIVKAEDPKVYKLYDDLIKLGLGRTGNDDGSYLPKMVKIAQSMSASESLAVARVFTHALNLVNIAENHHRFRMIRAEERENNDKLVREDSFEGTIAKLAGVDNEKIYEQLLKQKVEIVLTAHPTEVNRRTILRKHRALSEALSKLEGKELSRFERHQTEAELKRTIASIWGSDEIRRKKPDPQMEAEAGIAIIESTLWDAVPAHCRKLDAEVLRDLGKKMPPDSIPVKFASWIGGDRDGNPNVTPLVTKEVMLTLRKRAAMLLSKTMKELYDDLAISRKFSPEMDKLAERVINSNDTFEKYRRVTGHLDKRLSATTKYCESQLAKLAETGDANPGGVGIAPPDLWDDKDAQPIFDGRELKNALMIMYDSLVKTGFEDVADGKLKDAIRRFEAFGLTLTPLDIREESDKHTEAINAITKSLGIGSYADWDEKAKLSWLTSELSSKRPLFQSSGLGNMPFDTAVMKTLRTFEMAATLGTGSTGAYVISQARTASDVLAVMLLQKQFGMTSENGRVMRVVPLFETLTDLENAPDVVDQLFSLPGYLGLVKGKQEIMVGYSDSAKDAGRLAACWAQYTAQEKMAEVAGKHNVELTFFHGKGGTVGRGGNPSVYRAVLAHPPNTINGRFRVTEQGEMITQNFGSVDMAERTLDIYTSAVLREAFVDHIEPTQNWRNVMAKLSKVSCDAYRQMVRNEPAFVPYFRQATPELELGILNIGSRPAKRKPKGGIESLRAIPWTFAWTQTRVHLSAWLGCGEALNVSDEKSKLELREMYQNWPWFRETIDLIAMVLSKSDMSINENYDEQLVEKSDELRGLGVEIRKRLQDVRAGILTVSGCSDVGVGFELLASSMKIRNPFVDPVNVIQAEVMKKYRYLSKKEEEGKLGSKEREEKVVIEDALRVCISGVASGMRNSG